MAKEPKKPGAPGLFFISMFLTLALLMPLLGCLVVYSGWQGRVQAKAAEKLEKGIPIDVPAPNTDITLLVAVEQEKPTFILLRFHAPQAKLQISALPGESVLRGPNGPVSLEESYRAAGPGRAAQLISETLEITIDRYMAITPESISRVWGELEPPRINLSGLLSRQELGAIGLQNDPVITLHPKDAPAFIEGFRPGPARRARLEGAVWDAALRQRLAQLPKALPDGLRRESRRLLTDFSATDLFTLQKSLEWLTKQQTRVEAEPVPGHYDSFTGRFEFDTTSLAFMKERFGKAADRRPDYSDFGTAPVPGATAEPKAGTED